MEEEKSNEVPNQGDAKRQRKIPPKLNIPPRTNVPQIIRIYPEKVEHELKDQIGE